MPCLERTAKRGAGASINGFQFLLELLSRGITVIIRVSLRQSLSQLSASIQMRQNHERSVPFRFILFCSLGLQQVSEDSTLKYVFYILFTFALFSVLGSPVRTATCCSCKVRR